MSSVFVRGLLSGATVSFATTVTLAVLARLEGQRAVQPLNATSHWYLGNPAGHFRRVDIRHTGLGYATHFAASVFWATIFQGIRKLAPQRSPLHDAAYLTAVAAAVDYLIVPRRLTPGWEKVVTPKTIAAAYGVMAIALLITCPRRSNNTLPQEDT